VWKRGCFAWEYKSKGKDLGQALKQLKTYAGSLQNPPLLIVSDMEKIEIHTNWTNMVQETKVLTFDDLVDARGRQLLKRVFSETAVDDLKPGRKRSDLTKEVAEDFVELAQSLRKRGYEPEKVAHFVNRMVFCMFAEDVDLLPDKLFKRMLEASLDEPDSFVANAKKLFQAMANQNGRLDFKRIEWFNGGLFNDDDALPLTKADIKVALKAANQDWSNIDPSIMGTLFERGLDPENRRGLGAHYTDPEKIMLLIAPVIIEPLLDEWEKLRGQIDSEMDRAHTHKNRGERTKAEARAKELKTTFIERLKNFRVLDPACGSGNFLYLAIKALKDIEHRVNTEAEQMGLPRGFPVVGPENVKGIEINPFAAELARVSVWIGEIQWMREHGYDASRNPILRPLDTIECRDAILNGDGTEASWPEADVIVGNPPFLGAKLMKSKLRTSREESVKTTEAIRAAFAGRLAGFTDLVCYWFEKARAMTVDRKVARVGLVATSSIRGGTNRPVMDRICRDLEVYNAWSERPWEQDGARVEVSLICFRRRGEEPARLMLDGNAVSIINPDLTTGINVTIARPLSENDDVSFLGIQKSGPFDIPGSLAREWMRLPRNPNGRSNGEVLKPYWNGDDVTGRPRDIWLIDFPLGLSEKEASLFQVPFEYLRHASYQPDRGRPAIPFAPYRKNTPGQNECWWETHRPRPEMRSLIETWIGDLVTGAEGGSA
jgi:type II restriction/modification system DNA methylase subunit YeeA